ncbi:hypothetical protein Q9233_008247 [Columba guinea]|nr:hypothetical protein Q9233_008247 [Columba guinea]
MTSPAKFKKDKEIIAEYDTQVKDNGIKVCAVLVVRLCPLPPEEELPVTESVAIALFADPSSVRVFWRVTATFFGNACWTPHVNRLLSPVRLSGIVSHFDISSLLRMTNMTKIQKVEDPSLPFEVIKTQMCPLSTTGNVGKVVAKRIEVKLCDCLALYNSLSLCDQEIRAQLVEQLKCLDQQCELRVQLLQDLQDFFRKKAEIEMDYSRNLEKLAERFLAKTRSTKDQQFKKDQNVLSPVNCWNLLLNQVKRESRDHTTLSDIYLNNIIPRFVQVSEDSGRLFKKVVLGSDTRSARSSFDAGERSRVPNGNGRPQTENCLVCWGWGPGARDSMASVQNSERKKEGKGRKEKEEGRKEKERRMEGKKEGKRRKEGRREEGKEKERRMEGRKEKERRMEGRKEKERRMEGRKEKERRMEGKKEGRMERRMEGKNGKKNGREEWKEEWKGRMEGRMEGKKEGRMERRMEGKKEGRMERRMEGKKEGRMERRMEGKKEGRMERRMEGKKEGRMERRMEGKKEGRMERRMEGKKEGRMERRMEGKKEGRMERRMEGKKEGRMERRMEGKKEGRMERRMEGKKEGRMEGKKEGRMEGKKEGRMEGRMEGKKEGRMERRKEGKKKKKNGREEEWKEGKRRKKRRMGGKKERAKQGTGLKQQVKIISAAIGSKEVGLQLQEDLMKVLNELYTVMKTYHMYNADSISAQSKLKEAEKQEEKQIGKSVKQEDKQTPRSPDSTSNVKFEEKHVRRSSVKKIEKMKEKRQAKYTENRLKAIKARNEYLLALEATNASVFKYYIHDLSDLIDQCCDLGYHASLNRALRTFLSAELNLEQSKHEGLDAIENAVENLDANSDKQRLMEMYNNVFCPPMKFEFQPHMGDMESQLCAQQPVQSELVQRCQQLQSRLSTLKIENEEVKKTMEATLQTIQDIVTIEDFDVSDCFQYSNSMESVKSTVSETFMSKPSIAKRRANQQETEQFYFTKMKEYLEGRNLITKLQAKHDLLQKTLGESQRTDCSIAR